MNFLALLVGSILGIQIMWYVMDKRLRKLLDEARNNVTELDRLHTMNSEKYATMLQYSRGRYNGLLDAVNEANGTKAEIKEYV